MYDETPPDGAEAPASKAHTREAHLYETPMPPTEEIGAGVGAAGGVLGVEVELPIHDVYSSLFAEPEVFLTTLRQTNCSESRC